MFKNFFIIIFFLFFTLNLFSQTFKIYKGDTINYTDKNNFKQGKWIFFNSDYQNNIIQEGKYIDNKKNNVWKTYYSNGNKKSVITYKNNKQYGDIKLFNENGQIIESGTWKGNRWVGTYKFFYDNGKPAYIWFFNQEGKRTGIQQYFYKNGNIHINGYWEDGKEDGTIQEYYSNGKIKKESHWEIGKRQGVSKEFYVSGEIKSKKTYSHGVLDETSIIYYARNNNNSSENNNNNDNVNENNNENNNSGYTTFTGTGYHKLFNEHQQITMEGNFKKGILMKGKKYYYNENNDLVRTDIIEKGKIVKIIREDSE